MRSEGLEPPTYKFVACCSIQLSYDRMLRRRFHGDLANYNARTARPANAPTLSKFLRKMRAGGGLVLHAR